MSVKITQAEYEQLRDGITNLQKENRRLRKERGRFVSYKALHERDMGACEYPIQRIKLVSFRLSDVVAFERDYATIKNENDFGDTTEITTVCLRFGDTLSYYNLIVPYNSFRDTMYEYTNGFY